MVVQLDPESDFHPVALLMRIGKTEVAAKIAAILGRSRHCSGEQTHRDTRRDVSTMTMHPVLQVPYFPVTALA
jgi:hypothetical protein